MKKLHFETEAEIYAKGCKKGAEIEQKRILEIIDKFVNGKKLFINDSVEELKSKIKGDGMWA